MVVVVLVIAQTFWITASIEYDKLKAFLFLFTTFFPSWVGVSTSPTKGKKKLHDYERTCGWEERKLSQGQKRCFCCVVANGQRVWCRRILFLKNEVLFTPTTISFSLVDSLICLFIHIQESLEIKPSKALFVIPSLF